ncbi:RTA1-domain-containing protein [Aulographum hederae CBS 113979]|uniref:RTA1-domain-containing protein n=1 Tax=Aulographum hederae CBS 113979 TaxID=1176131 RepID=A0A6G1H3P0_9PEZI|nr:RTA1-domain-containing protein [Aulographum hederae CBS 113979]
MSTAYFECLNGDYNERATCRDHCTLSVNPPEGYFTCPMEASFWRYLPSYGANGAFIGLFSLSLTLFLIQGFMSRRFLGFSIAMVLGCILEVVGYVARIKAHDNPFAEAAFLAQIVTLTIAPAFLAAGIYLCLSRIVLAFGASNSRLSPKMYPRVFIPCDVVSLLLQAAGGGLASSQSHQNKDPTTGNNIMIAGLAFQVATLLVFIVLAADFSVRTWMRVKSLGREGALDPTHERLRSSWAFQGFLIALALSTLCIFTRCVYRVAELSDGWDGHLINTQRYFIGLEGALVAISVLVLNAFHPGLCFREGDRVERYIYRSDKAQEIQRAT